MKDGSEVYPACINRPKSKDGYNPIVKPEELGNYIIGLTEWLANLPEEEFDIMINRLKSIV